MSAGVSHRLPTWRRVLAVVAHPDDESFGLGALLAAFADAGSDVGLLCLTRGEASTLHGVGGDLRRVRADELAAAGRILGVNRTVLLGYPDADLASVCRSRLVGEVVDAARVTRPDGLLAFDEDGVTGHPDHTAATAAALGAADLLDLPVLGWTLPASVSRRLNAEHGTAFTGHEPDYVVAVDRTRQRAAALAHASQALPTSVLWRRLELLGDVENLHRLRTRREPTGESEPLAHTTRSNR